MHALTQRLQGVTWLEKKRMIPRTCGRFAAIAALVSN